MRISVRMPSAIDPHDRTTMIPSPSRPAHPRAAAALLLALAAGACGDDPIAVEPRIYEVRVEQETFRISLADPSRIAEAEALRASGTHRIVFGHLAAGDGGHNVTYSWHLRPETVEFVDVTMEACSGRPRSDVEADLPYWLNTMKVYCPWSATIVGRVE